MKLSAIALILALESASAFSPSCVVKHSNKMSTTTTTTTTTTLFGYLDDLSAELYGEDGNPIPEEELREATQMSKEDVANFGVGKWDDYVEFDEFDGGDGQMGVAGDGNKKLEQFDTSEIAKSKSRSARVAWGKSTGYADTLRDKGWDTQRAQQLENWHSQQEVLSQRKAQRAITDEFDQVETEDEDWRKLASFGVQRNEDFDLDEAFGEVQVGGDLEGVIELTGRLNGPAAVYEFGLRNQYMGFADFRASFTSETGEEWTVTPTEGALKQREDTQFIVRFKAQAPGVNEGHLVIETEDFKKTWKLVGSTN